MSMKYNPHMGAIPGYDALVSYNEKKRRYKDWQKNVGSKGRRIAYADRRPDFGSTGTAFKEVTSGVASTMASVYLPFRMAKFFSPKRIHYRGRYSRGFVRYR